MIIIIMIIIYYDPGYNTDFTHNTYNTIGMNHKPLGAFRLPGRLKTYTTF